MPTFPRVSKSRADKAGDRLRKWFTSTELGPPDPEEFVILDQWRALHGAPMQATNMFLRGALKNLGIDGQVKQRHKRHPQILSKLARQSTRLSQMEDIGGCRVILPSPDEVRGLEEHIRRSGSKTRLVSIDDYVSEPRRWGYRAVHLHTVRDGMKVEIQLRTDRQHQWAEAVEEWDQAFTSDLKHEAGPEAVLMYFRLLAEAYVLEDQGEQVPSELVEQLRAMAERVGEELG